MVSFKVMKTTSNNASHLRVLICTINAGNAEPSVDSIAVLIPYDGCADNVVKETPYPIGFHQREQKMVSKIKPLGRKPGSSFGRFDIIVVGMQEATFKAKSVEKVETKCEELNSSNGLLSDSEKSNKNIVKETIASAHLSYRSSIKSENFMRKGGFTSKAESAGDDTRIVHRLIADRCPSYVFVTDYLHGAIRLMVLVKKKIMRFVDHVTCKSVSTGIGSVLANKGGIVATLSIKKTHITFITAHLEAHEGYNHYLNRNANMASILEGGKDGKYDVSISSHHTFVCGDLNYRLKFPSVFADPELAGHRTKELLKIKNWCALNDMDELHQGLKRNEVLVGFKTLACNFPPTFKVKRENGYEYLSQRTPR